MLDLGAAGTVDAIIGTVDGLIENVLQSAFAAAIILVGGPNGTTTQIAVTRAAPVPTAPPCTGAALAQAASQYNETNGGSLGIELTTYSYECVQNYAAASVGTTTGGG